MIFCFRGNDGLEVTRNLKQAKPNGLDSRLRENDGILVSRSNCIFYPVGQKYSCYGMPYVHAAHPTPALRSFKQHFTQYFASAEKISNGLFYQMRKI